MIRAAGLTGLSYWAGVPFGAPPRPLAYEQSYIDAVAVADNNGQKELLVHICGNETCRNSLLVEVSPYPLSGLTLDTITAIDIDEYTISASINMPNGIDNVGLWISDIPHISPPADKVLISRDGQIAYRHPVELRSDMNAAAAVHTHAASDITSGTLSTDRYSAYADLVAESKIGAGSDQVASGDHTHSGVYEPVIAAGTTSQYWRGDKTWQTFPSSMTPSAHQLDSATYHTVSGLTTGHFLKALSATTFGFAEHGLIYSDVGAQAADADLSAIAALTGTGIACRTADNTWTLRSIAEGTSISVANGDGVSGNPTISVSIASGGTGNNVVVADGGLKYRTIDARVWGASLIDGSGSSGHVAFWSDADTLTSDSALYWDNTNKRLGIGTTTPSVNMEIYGAAASELRVRRAGQASYFAIEYNTSTCHIGLNAADDLTIRTNGTDNLWIYGTGKVRVSSLEMPTNTDFTMNAYWSGSEWKRRAAGYAFDTYQNASDNGTLLFAFADNGDADSSISWKTTVKFNGTIAFNTTGGVWASQDVIFLRNYAATGGLDGVGATIGFDKPGRATYRGASIGCFQWHPSDPDGVGLGFWVPSSTGTSSDLFRAADLSQYGWSTQSSGWAGYVASSFWNTNGAWPYFGLVKSKSTTIGEAIANSDGDTLGTIDASGVTSGNTFCQYPSARIAFLQDGSAGATYVGGLIRFMTGTNSSYLAERLRITSTASTLYTSMQIKYSGTVKSTEDYLVIENTANAADMDGTGTGILLRQWYYAGTPAVADAARISYVTDLDWTDDSNTREGRLKIALSFDGELRDIAHIVSDKTYDTFQLYTKPDIWDNDNERASMGMVNKQYAMFGCASQSTGGYHLIAGRDAYTAITHEARVTAQSGSYGTMRMIAKIADGSGGLTALSATSRLFELMNGDATVAAIYGCGSLELKHPSLAHGMSSVLSGWTLQTDTYGYIGIRDASTPEYGGLVIIGASASTGPPMQLMAVGISSCSIHSYCDLIAAKNNLAGSIEAISSDAYALRVLNYTTPTFESFGNGTARIKTFEQNDPPTTSDLAEGAFCFWKDTNDSDKIYLCYRISSSILKVQLT